MKNEITSITFLRGEMKSKYVLDKDRQHIILTLKGEIPGMGYSAKEIRKMLKKWNKSTNL